MILTERSLTLLTPTAAPAASSRSRLLRIAVFSVWSMLVTAGFGTLLLYGQLAGGQDTVPDNWPMNSRLPVLPRRRHLIMFVHPRCPCSRASLDELASIRFDRHALAEVLIVFVRPPDLNAGWEQDRLWRQAGEIPAAQRVVDPEGKEAARFGAKTSGHTFVFDAAGKLQFSGGITAFRGHTGENVGRHAVEEVMQGRHAVRRWCIYGCPLLNPSRPSPEHIQGVMR